MQIKLKALAEKGIGFLSVDIKLEQIQEEKLKEKIFIDPKTDEFIPYEQIKEKYGEEFIYDQEICFMGHTNHSVGRIDFLQSYQDIFSNHENDISKIDMKGRLKNFFSQLDYFDEKFSLNHLKAGNERQLTISKHLNDYKETCELLKEKNLYEINGFRFGGKWFAKPLPPSLIELFNKIKSTIEYYEKIAILPEEKDSISRFGLEEIMRETNKVYQDIKSKNEENNIYLKDLTNSIEDKIKIKNEKNEERKFTP